MAIGARPLLGNTDISDGSTAIMDSTTYIAGRLYLISVRSRTAISTEPNTPTLSLTGLTFTNIGALYTDTSGSSRQKMSLFYATCQSDVTGQISLAFGGQTQTAITWAVDEIVGVNVSSPVVQSATAIKTSADAAVTTLTATLSAFSHTSNALYALFSSGNASVSLPVIESGSVQVSRVLESAEDAATILTSFKPINDTTATFTFNSDTELGIIAIELRAKRAKRIIDASSTV